MAFLSAEWIDRMTQLGFMWRLVRYRPILFTLDAFLWTAIRAFPIVFGLIVRALFDALTAGNRLDHDLGLLLLLLATATIAELTLVLLASRTDVVLAFSQWGLMRHNLLKNILEKPGAKSLPNSPGSALNCFQDDIENIGQSVDDVVNLIALFVFAVIAIAILIEINARITLLVFLPTVVIVGIARLVRKRLQSFRKAARESTARVVGFIGEMFRSVQAVKVASAESNVIAHFQTLNLERHQNMLRDGVLSVIVTGTFSSTVNLGVGFILFLAAPVMHAGQFSVGDFSIFVVYLGIVAHFIGALGGFFVKYQQAGVSLSRLIELLQGDSAEVLSRAAPLVSDRQPPELPQIRQRPLLKLLELRQISYQHPSTRRGVRDISMLIRGGSLTVIVGPTGSGKTTLVRVLLGLLRADEGRILWNGELVDDPPSFFVPPRSAYTPQVARITSGTIAENILLGLPRDRVDLIGAIEAAAIDTTEFQSGIEAVVGPRGVKLSGGQVQRIAAARMFIREAELLVIDDVESALDIETERKLLGQLLERNSTCLIVSQRPALLAQADQVVVLRDGRIHAMGTPDEVLAISSDLRRLFENFRG